MAGKVKPVPAGYHTVTPYLVVRGANEAIEFYKKAFGAQEMLRMPMPDGKIVHAEIKIGDSVVMLGEENPQMGAKSPQSLGGSPVSIFLYVPEVDATYKQAIAAGAKQVMPPADQFWGDRFGKLTDPFGHEWGLATHTEDVAPEELMKRAAEAFGKSAGA